MITANELRIGNWVAMDKEFNQIRRDDFEMANYIESTFEPIPLTPEILEKAGFEKDIYMRTKDVISSIRFTRYLNAIGIIINIKLLKNGKTLIMFSGCEKRLIDPNYIKHLHQLQNLYFALTGEELAVEL